MTIREAQEAVDRWIKEYGVRYFSELTNMAVLTEEVGELARVMARKYGDQSFKAGERENLGEEIGRRRWTHRLEPCMDHESLCKVAGRGEDLGKYSAHAEKFYLSQSVR